MEKKTYEKTYYYLLIIYLKKIIQKQIHVHLHAHESKINSLLAHLSDTTIQLKFSTRRSHNLSENVFCFGACQIF